MGQYTIQTDLSFIAKEAEKNDDENDRFRRYLKGYSNPHKIDDMVHALNDTVSAAIDCTTCGNCCKSLMINVTEDELQQLSTATQQPIDDIKQQYVDKGWGNEYVINAIPCHFLTDNKCTIYEHRFQGCRDFPHLHQDNFIGRLFSMNMHYGTCPIIYNVMEQLKSSLGFER